MTAHSNDAARRDAAHVVGVIVVGGGSGQRFGSLKQFETIGQEGEHRVIDRSVEVAVSAADCVAVVVPADCVDAERAVFADRYGARVSVVAGGPTRSASVRSGLQQMPEHVEVICVHDAARPLATVDLYRRVVAAVVEGADGVVPAVGVTDTIKLIDDHGWVLDTPPRDRLVAAQTPQGFSASILRRAHAAEPDGSDDAVLVEGVGGRVRTIDGERDNIKITHPDDLALVAEANPFVPSGGAGRA